MVYEGICTTIRRLGEGEVALQEKVCKFGERQIGFVEDSNDA